MSRRVARNFDREANNIQGSTLKYLMPLVFKSITHKTGIFGAFVLNNFVQILSRQIQSLYSFNGQVLKVFLS